MKTREELLDALTAGADRGGWVMPVETLITEAGYALVPLEPTDAMVNSADGLFDNAKRWRAMLKASTE